MRANRSILSLFSRTNCTSDHKAEALMNRSEADQKLVLGHDLSTLQQLEDVGRTFSDEGWAQPVERIVAHHGATYIRERLWVNPPIAYNDLPHILTMARRIKAAGTFMMPFWSKEWILMSLASPIIPGGMARYRLCKQTSTTWLHVITRTS